MLSFLNLTRTNAIGANCYLLEIDGQKILLDAGADPKIDGPDCTPLLDNLRSTPPDTVLITHSHLDHIGSLPIIQSRFPNATVFMTHPTARLTDALLHNSVNVMTSQRDELDIPAYPLYTHSEVDDMSPEWQYIDAGKKITLDSGVAFTAHDAGHILGSVAYEIRGTDGRRIIYTGDLHTEDQGFSLSAKLPEKGIDTLIIETTRGAYQRPPDYTRQRETTKLARSISRTFARGGAVLIPVFALGKTQELLLILHELKKSSQLPDCPVFIAGLSAKINEIFDSTAGYPHRGHRGLHLRKEIDFITPRRRGRGRKKSTPLRYRPGCIYALTSGMMSEHTASNDFARQFISNPKNSLLFVGYAEPSTPAGKIRATTHGEKVRLDSRHSPQRLTCEVEIFDFSGHAPREDLLDYIERTQPRRAVLVHGDTDALQWFEEQIRQRVPATQPIIPPPGETLHFDN